VKTPLPVSRYFCAQQVAVPVQQYSGCTVIKQTVGQAVEVPDRKKEQSHAQRPVPPFADPELVQAVQVEKAANHDTKVQAARLVFLLFYYLPCFGWKVFFTFDYLKWNVS
jgi:hypothetical protein